MRRREKKKKQLDLLNHWSHEQKSEEKRNHDNQRSFFLSPPTPTPFGCTLLLYACVCVFPSLSFACELMVFLSPDFLKRKPVFVRQRSNLMLIHRGKSDSPVSSFECPFFFLFRNNYQGRTTKTASNRRIEYERICIYFTKRIKRGRGGGREREREM